jgi:putative phosphoesterase
MPGYADGPGIGPHITDAELATWLIGYTADVVCVGHTHIPFIRVVNQVTIINPGAVRNPLAPDLRASYVLQDADRLG